MTACNSDNESPQPNADDCVIARSIRNGEIIENQYIVAYNNEDLSTNSAEISQKTWRILHKNGIDIQAMEATFIGEPSGFVAKLSTDQVAILRQDPAIALIEPDRIVAMCTCFTVVNPRTIRWGVNQVGYGNGIGKTAWVIDTGIDLDHPDLNVDRTRSRSFIPNQTSANDENGHGTHVAGIIGALNNEIGTLGVASGANLVALKVLNHIGEGSMSGVVAAVGYARRNGRAGDVINLSLGGEGNSEILNREIQSAANQGFFVAIAAGNEGEPARNFSPARVNGRNIYTISALDSLGSFARFSNYGNDVVDYSAPGVRIISTYSDGRYARLSGTSMAAPHVAGILLVNNGRINNRGVVRNDLDDTPDTIAGL